MGSSSAITASERPEDLRLYQRFCHCGLEVLVCPSSWWSLCSLWPTCLSSSTSRAGSMLSSRASPSQEQRRPLNTKKNEKRKRSRLVANESANLFDDLLTFSSQWEYDDILEVFECCSTKMNNLNIFFYCGEYLTCFINKIIEHSRRQTVVPQKWVISPSPVKTGEFRYYSMSHLSSRMSCPLFSKSWTSADAQKTSWRPSWGHNNAQCCKINTTDFTTCTEYRVNYTNTVCQ